MQGWTHCVGGEAPTPPCSQPICECYMRLFNRVSLLTPESVELELTLAGIGNRTLALIIDYSILFLILLVFWLAWLIVFHGAMSYAGAANWNYSQLPLWLLAIALLGNFAIYSGYFVFFEVMWQGQTPGKRFTTIRVVRDDGRPVGVSQAIMRSLLRPVDDFCFIGVLFILFGKREKRIGDWAAGTIVVQQSQDTNEIQPGVWKRWRSHPNSQPIHFSNEACQLANQLPNMANLSTLLLDDFAVLQEYLRRRSNLKTRAHIEKSLQLAHQLQLLIQLETIPPNITPDHFIEAVYLAYQNQTNKDPSDNKHYPYPT